MYLSTINILIFIENNYPLQYYRNNHNSQSLKRWGIKICGRKKRKKGTSIEPRTELIRRKLFSREPFHWKIFRWLETSGFYRVRGFTSRPRSPRSRFHRLRPRIINRNRDCRLFWMGLGYLRIAVATKLARLEGGNGERKKPLELDHSMKRFAIKLIYYSNLNQISNFRRGETIFRLQKNQINFSYFL